MGKQVDDPIPQVSRGIIVEVGQQHDPNSRAFDLDSTAPQVVAIGGNVIDQRFRNLKPGTTPDSRLTHNCKDSIREYRLAIEGFVGLEERVEGRVS